MRQQRLIALTVPGTSGREIGTVGSVDNKRTFPRSVGSPAQSCSLGGQLLICWCDKIDKLDLKDRPPANGCQADAGSHNRGFRKRRINYTVGECFAQAFGEAKDAALGIFYVLSEEEDTLVGFQEAS